jgi:hypothetical protein
MLLRDWPTRRKGAEQHFKEQHPDVVFDEREHIARVHW